MRLSQLLKAVMLATTKITGAATRQWMVGVFPFLLTFGLVVLFLPVAACDQSDRPKPEPVAAEAAVVESEPGYPRQMVFRRDTPVMLEADQEKVDMVVSDHAVWTRNYGHEAFAKKHPGKPVLIHAGGDFMSANAYAPRQMLQDRGLLDGEFTELYVASRGGFAEVLAEDFVPAPGFLGYWVYEAGVDTQSESLPGRVVSLQVPDTVRFEPRFYTPPSVRGEMRKLTGSDRVNRIVVLCPRDKEGNLDWPQAEMAEVLETDAGAGVVTVRRLNAGGTFPELTAGTYLAASAPVWDRPFVWGTRSGKIPDSHPLKSPVWPFLMPNFSPLCPVDPSNGLNAAQWFARQFIERKRAYYPQSSGYALDVTTDTHFPKSQHVEFADLDNDGVVDRGFVDGVSWWALGLHDFVHYMREGVAGKFGGLGRDLLITWDSTDNNGQRLFHLVNGAEYEHTMIVGAGSGPAEHMYSSRLDRLLLWAERALAPNITFISNKQPNEAYHGGTAEELAAAQKKRPNYALHYARLDMASSCLAAGYVNLGSTRSVPANLIEYPGRQEEIDKYGVPRLQDYDEFHRGEDGVRHWLGQPLGPAARYRNHLGPVVYSFGESSAMPEVSSSDPRWEADAPERVPPDGFRVEVRRIGPYVSGDQVFTLSLRLPLAGLVLEEMAEYAVSFNLRATSPYGQVASRYAPIPRNISLRFKVDDRIHPEKVPAAVRSKGYYQECLAFPESRRVELTLQAPASGEGVLEICVSETPGTVEISNLEIRRGCADVLYREFENGLVLVNGSSVSPVEIDVPTLFPGAAFSRLRGTQDPVHNNGELAKQVTLGVRDGIFLQRNPASSL
jgi:hypothetical protein